MADKPQPTAHHSRRYPAARTSPWFFVVLISITVIFILAGIFAVEPITRFLRWLAVVL
ncbi:MAG: hypothetical protein ACRETC_04065 [Gammaproteobacteria bacterium]